MTRKSDCVFGSPFSSRHSINKEEYIHPCGSGCGSVETCRKAARVCGREVMSGGGRVIGVGEYGNCSA